MECPKVPVSLIDDSIVKVITNNADLVKLQQQWIMAPNDVELLSDADWEELSLSSDGEKALKGLVAPQPKLDNQQQLLGTILDTLQRLVQVLKVKVDEPEPEKTCEPVCETITTVSEDVQRTMWYDSLDYVEAKRMLSRCRNKNFTREENSLLEHFILDAINEADIASLKYFLSLWDEKLDSHSDIFYTLAAEHALQSCDRPTIMFVKEHLFSDNTKCFEKAFLRLFMFRTLTVNVKNVFQLGPILKNDLFFTKNVFDLYLYIISDININASRGL